MTDTIASLISLAIIIAPFYFAIRFFRKRSDKKVKRAIEQHRIRSGYSNESNQVKDKVFIPSNKIVFTYLGPEGPTRKEILGHYRSEYILEGYDLNSQEVDFYVIEDILGFLEGTEKIYESLKSDPNIFIESGLEELEAHQSANSVDKTHKRWDESNPNEVFFKYKNSDGEIKDRVVLLQSYDAPYLKGICKLANGMRTFREDRIQTYYKDSKKRIESFKFNPHYDRELISISFLGFPDDEFEQHKLKGSIYNYRALKTVTNNTAIIVANKELTPAQQTRADRYGCTFIEPENLHHFLETGEVQSTYQTSRVYEKDEVEYLNRGC